METLDIERRRRGVLVQGALGKFLMVELFTMAECQAIWDRGGKVPLDLTPPEYWSPVGLPFPRFGEEALGAEF